MKKSLFIVLILGFAFLNSSGSFSHLSIISRLQKAEVISSLSSKFPEGETILNFKSNA
ncbi:MAG: hypothetical protein K8S87_01610 [Planctomycetes bacterium]|nr:hypothetical protein [Planctomycetota bacterium]